MGRKELPSSTDDPTSGLSTYGWLFSRAILANLVSVQGKLEVTVLFDLAVAVEPDHGHILGCGSGRCIYQCRPLFNAE